MTEDQMDIEENETVDLGWKTVESKKRKGKERATVKVDVAEASKEAAVSITSWLYTPGTKLTS